MRRVSPGVCVARERARREEAEGGGKGVGVRGDRERAEEGRARGAPGPAAQLLSLPQLSREKRQNEDE